MLDFGAGYWHTVGEQNVAKTREHKSKKKKNTNIKNIYNSTKWAIFHFSISYAGFRLRIPTSHIFFLAIRFKAPAPHAKTKFTFLCCHHKKMFKKMIIDAKKLKNRLEKKSGTKGCALWWEKEEHNTQNNDKTHHPRTGTSTTTC